MKGMHSIILGGLSLLLWGPLSLAPSLAQNFDCSKASAVDEHAICDSPELSWFDKRLNRLYGIAVKKLDRNGRRNLAREQRTWLTSRKRCGSDRSCLLKRYEIRIDDLEYLPITGIVVPSYRCDGRLNPTEKAICDTPSLARLDASLSRQFVKTKHGLPRSDYISFLNSQSAWLKSRQKCFDDVSCIGATYKERVMYLKGLLREGRGTRKTETIKSVVKAPLKPKPFAGGASISSHVPSNEKREALIIGNSSYKNGSILQNPKNDAQLIAQSLRKTGFKVRLLLNASQGEMKRAMRNFGRTLRASNAIGLFYYAGHGVQVKGENYLIPIDANIIDETEVEIESINVNSFLQTMESARSRMNIIILDACRSNPFGSKSRAGSQGLAPVRAPNGTFIGYATSPGDVAQDGDGQNSPYAKAIASNLLRPNLSIEQVFKKVRIEVQQETEAQQMPWDLSSLTGDFYFLKK